ncbi:serine/threonine-protein kinase, partial [Angustibacter aerolatus]
MTGDDARLGPYRLRGLLGEGGMGVVHLGLDQRGRAVAIKVLRAHIAHDPDARARLAREVVTLRRVRHPLVAEVLDADVDGEQPYVVTRFVPGPGLDAVVREGGPLRPDQLVRLGRGLTGALTAIHAAGVVHRDLKPGNVLLLDDDPVVIDFGIAHVADDVRLTSVGLVMGTPGYLSPELVDGDDVGTATDWWGWAATLAYAASGRAPFGRGPMDVVLDRVRRGDSDLTGVDPRLRPVLAAELAVDPAARPAAREVLDALEGYADGG